MSPSSATKIGDNTERPKPDPHPLKKRRQTMLEYFRNLREKPSAALLSRPEACVSRLYEAQTSSRPVKGGQSAAQAALGAQVRQKLRQEPGKRGLATVTTGESAC